MLYGFSVNDCAISLYKWNQERNRAEHYVSSLDNGQVSVRNCMYIEAEGFLFGDVAFNRYVTQQKAIDVATNSYIEGVSGKVFNATNRFCAVRNSSLTGVDITNEFFDHFKELYPRAGGDSMIIEIPSVDFSYESAFKQCTDTLCDNVEYYPSWFLKLLSALYQKNQEIPNGRILFVDLGDCECCAVVADVKCSLDSKELCIQRVSLRGYSEKILSHKLISKIIVDELIDFNKLNDYSAAGAIGFLYKQKDYKVLLSAAEKYEKHLMNLNKCDFSVFDLYNNKFFEKLGLTPEWMQSVLEKHEIILKYKNLIADALSDSGTSLEKIEKVFITKESGRLFRKLTAEVVGEEKLNKEKRSITCEAAEGGATLLGYRNDGWQIHFLPEQKKIICFSAETADGEEYIKETGQYNQYFFSRKKYLSGSIIHISTEVGTFSESGNEEDVENSINRYNVPAFSGDADFLEFVYDGKGDCLVSFIKRGKIVHEENIKIGEH